MLLHDLKWSRRFKANHDYAWATDKITLSRFDDGTYEIYQYIGPSSETDRLWRNLDMLTAQAVLIHLTQDDAFRQ
jgi:hypothetical protein